MMRNIFEKTIVVFSWAAALSLCLFVLVFVGYLLFRGFPSLGQELIFGDARPIDAILGRARVFDGLFPAIVGTLFLVGLSVLLALPPGICTGIYLSEYSGPKTRRAFGLFFDILAGIPSILIGLFGFSAAVVAHRHFSGRLGPCLLVSALSLAFLVLPYLIRSTQNALQSLPEATRRTAPALGATRLQNLAYVLLPRALPGIGSGLILSIGRCAEDTAVIMLTGVVATAGLPRSLLSQYEALPFYIYYISGQYADQAELARGYGACLILLVTCGLLFMLAFFIQKRLFRQALYRV